MLSPGPDCIELTASSEGGTEIRMQNQALRSVEITKSLSAGAIRAKAGAERSRIEAHVPRDSGTDRSATGAHG
jgi:DNA recombination-dependent growth factor C